MTATPEPPANPSASAAPTAPGLPAVQPPSGTHILQMFLVPGLIVGFIVVVLIGFTWLFGGPRTPEEWIKKLRDPNSDVRWRAAADLTQVLPRDKELSADADFALQLTALLDDTLQSSAEEEKAIASRLEKFNDIEAREKEWQKVRAEPGWKKLEADRDFSTFLCGCLGKFTVPVGVPLLKRMAEQTDGVERHSLAMRRWIAVWTLANLCQKLSADFADLPDLRKQVMQQQLEKALDRKDLAKWAGPALEYVKKRRAGEGDAMGLDATFARLADPKTSDPLLRELVILAINFWDGTDAENERMDLLLVDLTRDSGAGSELLAEMAGTDLKLFTVPESVSALDVSWLAARALANRGSKHARVAMLVDMLDEDYLKKVMRKATGKDGKTTSGEAAVLQTMMDTLKAVGQLHRKRPETDLSSLRPAIDNLAGHSIKAVREEAKSVQKALDAK